jgi:hypothetical protein
MKLKIFLAFLPVMLSLTGCNVYACKYETRFVQVRATTASPQVGSVNVESMGFRHTSRNNRLKLGLVRCER